MAARIAAFDWARTELGPTSQWPQSLKTAVSICLGSGVPMMLGWGAGLINLYNDALAPLLGGRHPLALGRSWRDTWVDEWPSIGRQVEDLLARDGAVLHERVRLSITRQGLPEDVWFTWSGGPIRDERGEVGGFFITCLEDPRLPLAEPGEGRQVPERERLVLEAERSREALRESEQRFHLLAETLPHMIWTAYPDGTVDYFNRKWYEYTGNTKGTSGDAAWQPAFDDETGNRVHEAWYQAVRTGQPYELEYWLRRASDGMDRWHLARAMPLRDETGTIVRWFGAITDIHDLKEAQTRNERLLLAERARTDAERAGRMKDEFLASLSHELRTPLNAILGWSQLLSRGAPTPEKIAQGLRTIERNARAQTRLIDDLLDMSRIISGKVALDARPIDVNDVVQAAVETVRPTAAAKEIEIRVDVAPEDGFPATGDFNRLQQIFWNILSNAIKFTPRHGLVTIGIGHKDSMWEVDVTDTGEGMSADFLPHVFDRFRQADASTTRQHGGLGLGLSIVKQLVDLHAGLIRAASDGLGQGSTFTVSLPVRVSHAETSTEGSEEPASDREPAVRLAVTPALDPTAERERWGPTLAGAIRGRRAVVLDDDPDARVLVKELLSECGVDVIVAATADEALAAVERDRPDVLISDIGMPLVDGYEVIRRVRALPADRGGRTPAIALTAFARAEDRVRAARAGFQAHVPKPVEPAELIAIIAGLVG